jgi:hypothetical protein
MLLNKRKKMIFCEELSPPKLIKTATIAFFFFSWNTAHTNNLFWDNEICNIFR